MVTQNERVAELLRERGALGLTPLEALELAGSLRLAARVSDLRDRSRGLIRDDEEVVTEYVTRGKTTYARYVLRRRESPARALELTLPW